MEEILDGDEEDFFWDSISLCRHLRLQEFDYSDSLIPDYYLLTGGFEPRFRIEEIKDVYRSPWVENQITAWELILPRIQTSQLQQFRLDPRVIRGQNKLINSYLDFGDRRFLALDCEGIETKRSHSIRTTELVSKVCQGVTSTKVVVLENTDLYPRETITLYKDTILYLGALVTHLLDTWLTKKELLDCLTPKRVHESDSCAYDETWDTAFIREDYIKDLVRIKQLAVRLILYRRIINWHRFELVRRLALLEHLFEYRPGHPIFSRFDLPPPITSIINGYLWKKRDVNLDLESSPDRGVGPLSYVHFTNNFPIDPRAKWGVRELKGALENLRLLQLDGLSQIEIRVGNGWWTNILSSCFQEISENLHCLSFISEEAAQTTRDPWLDINTRDRVYKVCGNVVEGEVVVQHYRPTEWLDETPITVKIIGVSTEPGSEPESEEDD